MSQEQSYADCFELLLADCPPLRWNPPWSFLPPDDDCRGPVCDPEQTLATLRTKCDDQILEQAGIVERVGQGHVRIKPVLTNRTGVIVALRQSPDQPPFTLLTARGCLRHDDHSVSAALQDSRTRTAMQDTGVLFVPFHMNEVAFLRMLGLPATLGTGLHRLTPDQLCTLVASVTDSTSRPLLSEVTDSRATEPHEEPAAKNTGDYDSGLKMPTRLGLLGWSPLPISTQFSALLPRLARHLTDIRRYLGIELAEVCVWQPAQAALENLRYRTGTRNLNLVRDILLDSADQLYDIERYAAPKPGLQSEPATSADTFITAQANLMAQLADDRGHGQPSHRARIAMKHYEDVLRRDLIVPLQTSALESDDPIIRNAGVALSITCALLHRMSPTLHELQLCDFEASATDTTSRPAKLFEQYLRIAKQFGNLVSILSRYKRGR